MSGMSFINGASKSANFKTETCLILVIFMLSGKSSLYIINFRTFEILNSSNLVKSNLLLGRVI